MISKEEAARAFAGTSMVPDERGEQIVREIEDTLKQDYNLYYAQIPREQEGLVASFNEMFASYKAGYIKRYREYLGARSKIMSAFVAGPSKFPTRSNNKKADSAASKMQLLIEYRKRMLAKMHKLVRPDLYPVMSGDGDAIEKLQEKLEKAEWLQDIMKRGNRIARSKKMSDQEKIEKLMALGLKERNAKQALEPDVFGDLGFPKCTLQNNGAKIRSIKKRLEELQRTKKQDVKTWLGVDGVLIQDDPPADRVRLFFSGKPDEETRDYLKKHGFRWATSVGAWQAYRNTRSNMVLNEYRTEENRELDDYEVLEYMPASTWMRGK